MYLYMIWDPKKKKMPKIDILGQFFSLIFFKHFQDFLRFLLFSSIFFLHIWIDIAISKSYRGDKARNNYQKVVYIDDNHG